MDYEKLCSQILKLDPKIRLAAVYNTWAEHIAGGPQKGMEAHLPKKVTQEAVNQAILRWKTRQKMDEWVGKAKYAMAEYEKVKRITFYLNDNDLLLITTEPDADHLFIIFQTQKLLN